MADWNTKYGPKPAGWDNMDNAVQQAWLKSLENNSRTERRGGLQLDKDLFDFDQYTTAFQKINIELDKAYSSMANMGAFFVKDGPMAIGLEDIAKKSDMWFGSAKRVSPHIELYQKV